MGKPLDYLDFIESLDQGQPDPLWPEALKALWHDGRGDWQRAHDIAQEIEAPIGCWIHGYLHRKEGDRWNAEYWYRRAGKPYPKATLPEEYKTLIRTALLEL